MGIFSRIRDSIFGKKEEKPKPAATAPAAPKPAAAPAKPAPIAEIDVEARLATMAEGKTLNWRTSIVDLMKLVGLESSLAERKELADELGYAGDKSDSASMNIWLHAQVIQKIRDNGGRLPTDL